jgi:hypothetical protein
MATRKTSTRARRSAASISEAAINRLWADFAASPAPLTGEQIDKIESIAGDKSSNCAVSRRVALAILGKSGRDLIDMTSGDDSDGIFAEMLAQADQYVAYAKSMLKLAEKAHDRLDLALVGREDYMAIVAAAAAARANVGGDGAEARPS